MLRHARIVFLFLSLTCIILSGCGGGGGGSEFPQQHSIWNINSQHYEFTLVGGSLDSDYDDFVMIFNQVSGLSDYPNATIYLNDAASLTVGVPIPCEAIYLNPDADTDFDGDSSDPVTVTFTTLGTTLGQTIHGTISGNLYADLDDDGDTEPYPLTATFNGVRV